jgi:competence protein ComEC
VSFTETNDNSVAILLIYGPAYVLLAGDAEVREEEYMASVRYIRPKRSSRFASARLPI